MSTPPTLTVELKNNTTHNTVYAYITGTALDSPGGLVLLQSDGVSLYRPVSPTDDQAPLLQDCAIPLGPPGSVRPVTIPHIGGCRVWFSLDQPMTFRLNRGPALVEPSVSNPSDPNIGISWAFAELTYNDFQLFANISYVDFVGLPIALDLRNLAGVQQYVAGIPTDGLNGVVSGLSQEESNSNAPWTQLFQRASSGDVLRILSPNLGMVMNGALFQNYYNSYVDQVYNRFSTQDISVDTQNQFGVLTGRVTNGNLVFTLPDGSRSETFEKPSTRDIFSCSTGPFEERNSDLRRAIIPRLAAGFNRSTLLIDTMIPGPDSSYYQNNVTNHYSRVVHETESDGRGYAFPYDDVAASGGSDHSGSVFDSNPSVLTIILGGGR